MLPSTSNNSNSDQDNEEDLPSRKKHKKYARINQKQNNSSNFDEILSQSNILFSFAYYFWIYFEYYACTFKVHIYFEEHT